jgi:hypothetical protein
MPVRAVVPVWPVVRSDAGSLGRIRASGSGGCTIDPLIRPKALILPNYCHFGRTGERKAVWRGARDPWERTIVSRNSS